MITKKALQSSLSLFRPRLLEMSTIGKPSLSGFCLFTPYAYESLTNELAKTFTVYIASQGLHRDNCLMHWSSIYVQPNKAHGSFDAYLITITKIICW